MPTKNKKKSKGKKQKSSVDKYFEKSRPNLEAISVDDTVRRAIAKTMSEKMKMKDQDTTSSNGEYFNEMAKPMEITPDISRTIQDIPTSMNTRWFVETWQDINEHDTFFYCNIYLVNDKTHKVVEEEEEVNDNEVPYQGKGNKLKNIIGSCFKHYEHEQKSSPDIPMTDEKDLVLGTIARTILGEGMMTLLESSMDSIQEKPKIIYFFSTGLIAKVSGDLKEFGIRKKQMQLAHSSVIEEGAVKRKIIDRIQQNIHNLDGLSALYHTDVPYVSETKKPLKGFTTSKVPMHWLTCPPPQGKKYRLCDLWGWRTNLEFAIYNLDEERVKKITSEHTQEEIREFCEIRQLLQKCALNGMVNGCKLLLKHCKVHVEGKRASTFPQAWMKMAEEGCSDEDAVGYTPLIAAAREGHYDVCELLLQFGASVEILDKKLNAPAIQHAISQGQKDIVRLLCQYKSDISFRNIFGQDSIDVTESFMQPECIVGSGTPLRQFQKIAEILREYDDRCSYCRMKPTQLKHCPCHKEK